jgi:hypothetical protein
MKLYRRLIRLVVTYAAETWILNISDKNALQIFERKVIRKSAFLLAKMVSGGLEPTQKLIFTPRRGHSEAMQNPLCLAGWAMWNVWRVKGPRNVY